MNTTLKEIIYNIKNLKQAGRQSQNTLLSDLQYSFIIDQYRSQLINQDYNKRKAINPVWEQTLEITFQRVRSMEGEIGDMKVYKALNLPRVVNLANRPFFTGVRTSLLSPSITRATSISIKHDLKSSLTGFDPRYFPLGDELYLVTPDPIQKLYVSAVFERPLKVAELKEGFDIYDPFNFDYPLSMNSLDTLFKMIVDGEIKFSMYANNDVEADGQEEKPTLPTTKAKPATTTDE